MADDDDLFYLQPGFDFNSLTVPRLRNILVEHSIVYPSGAKKGQLIEIVEQDLLPQAKKLLQRQARVRRTSKGITDVPSSQDSTLDDEGEDERQLMPPPPAPKTPRSRKSKSDLTSGSVAAAAVPTPSTSRRSKTPSRRSTTRTPRASDTEPEVENTVRRSRKSAPAQAVLQPSVKLEEPDRRLKRQSREMETSPFSDDNPFQSGSSPPSGSKRLSSVSRNRKSLASASEKKSPTKRRQTTSPPIKQEEFSPQRTAIEFPVSRLTANSPDGIPLTEEFTPDAARELAEQERNGQVAPVRTSALVRRKKQTPPSTAAKLAPWTVLTSILAVVGGLYRQEKVNIGYCGVGQPHWSLAENPRIPAWVHENFEPQCEPCPQHAICSSNMEVECEHDYVLKQHPLSLNGLVPVPPTCEPDSEKERRINNVAERVTTVLRDHRAAYECGDKISSSTLTGVTDSTDTKEVSTLSTSQPYVSEEELKSVISKQRRKAMGDQAFDDLWQGAIGLIMGKDEVEVTRDGLLYARSKLVAHQQATAQIPTLVATTLDRLATQAALKEDGRASEPYISVGQLRDDVLRNVFSASERERVWQNVRKVVEGNSNVRASTREGGKTGEWSRVWEWIGPVDLAPGLEGRRSGGLIRDSSANASARASPDNAEGRSGLGTEFRRWDEGRAIY
ncbi:hypothetical protein LTR84_002426 [Exophiala bonariae]|uniref:LEM-like domain-containing protein n=1 Tax=Exophiala bonariae TaxID=1690606 RepID=A0AAV9NC81_9EURO|nr:hypothetical protein LTR84_002426 [Exophiala bonariae]